MHFAVALLCLVGFYVSIRMYRKAGLAERGLLDEPSIVFSPRARVVGGVPNAAVGLAYYAALFVASFFLDQPPVRTASIVASILASALSVFLAYSLVAVTRKPCPYCWTGHVVNWLLLILLVAYRA